MIRRWLAATLFALLAVLGGIAGAVAQEEGDPLADGMLPVPTVTIYTGDTITDAMIEERQFPQAVRDRMAVVEGRRPLIGKVARRTLLPGKPIPVNAVVEPMMVTRGVLTQAVFRSGGVLITAIVFPLRSGAIGDLIQMRNIDSGQVISGIVQADGTVLIGGG